MTRLLRFGWLACVGLALAATAARAEITRMTADGTVYRIDVDPWALSGRVVGTALKSTRQFPKGGKEVTYIPGTDDAATDRDPAVEVDPSTGTVVVVWARNEGTGFNLYVTRYDGAWSAPRLLVRMDGDELEPQIRFDTKYLHVSWHQDFAGQTTWWRSSFRSGTLEQVFGPERIPTDDAVSVSPDGGPAYGTMDAPCNDVYFNATVFGRLGDPGRAYVWGVRDEPVPFNFRQSLLLPAEVRSVVAADAGFIYGRFTYWFTTTDRLYYTTLVNGQWSDMRLVELGVATSSDARLMLRDLFKRLAGGGL